MKDRPRTQDFDWILLAIVGAISATGVLEIYSSTHASAMAGMQWKQMIWIGIGVIAMFAIWWCWQSGTPALAPGAGWMWADRIFKSPR
jgi:cell division protein FtsW (lipid II flippase)